MHSGSILTCPPPPDRTNEFTSEESKKKPVKRTNSFSRRKNKGKGDEPGGGDGDGYSGDSDALQKPGFKLEEQKDPLREALQQEAGTCPGHQHHPHLTPRHQPCLSPAPPGPVPRRPSVPTDARRPRLHLAAPRDGSPVRLVPPQPTSLPMASTMRREKSERPP